MHGYSIDRHSYLWIVEVRVVSPCYDASDYHWPLLRSLLYKLCLSQSFLITLCRPLTMTRNNNIGMQSLSTAGVRLSPQELVVRSIAELSLRIRFPGVDIISGPGKAFIGENVEIKADTILVLSTDLRIEGASLIGPDCRLENCNIQSSTVRGNVKDSSISNATVCGDIQGSHIERSRVYCDKCSESVIIDSEVRKWRIVGGNYKSYNVPLPTVALGSIPTSVSHSTSSSPVRLWTRHVLWYLQQTADKRIKDLLPAAREVDRTEDFGDDIPEYLKDPVTLGLIHDVVIATSNGVAYDRDTIVQIIQDGGLDPLMREPLKQFGMCLNLQNQVEYWKEEYRKRRAHL